MTDIDQEGNERENPLSGSGPAQQHHPNQLLTVLQVCNQYGLHRTMVYDLLGTGVLPAKVIGKRGTRIRREDVENWIRSLPPYRKQKES